MEGHYFIEYLLFKIRISASSIETATHNPTILRAGKTDYKIRRKQ
jgi:hypothetical protein